MPFVLLFGFLSLLLRVVPVGAFLLRRRLEVLVGGLRAILAPVLVTPLLSLAVFGVVVTALRRGRRTRRTTAAA